MRPASRMLRPLLAVAAATAVITAGGCAGGNPAPATSHSRPASAAGSGSQSSKPQSGSAAKAAGGFTQQGGKLTFGQKAVVPFKSENQKGALGITVTAIDKGSPSDLAPLHLGDQVKGMVPYYIRVTVSNESGSDFSFTELSSMYGLLGDGSKAQKVSVIGSFDKCDNKSAASSFKTKGLTYQTCALALASGSAQVTGASYEDGTYTKLAPNTDYIEDPITWERG